MVGADDARARPASGRLSGRRVFQRRGLHAYICVPAQHIVGEFLATFKEFPPSQEAGSFSLNRVMEKLAEGATGGSR